MLPSEILYSNWNPLGNICFGADSSINYSLGGRGRGSYKYFNTTGFDPIIASRRTGRSISP